MPCLIRILTSTDVAPAHWHANSLAGAAAYEPDGVYTVANSFRTTKVLKFDAHLDRLEDSARRENISLRLDRPRLRAALRQLILDAGYGDARFRITVPRNQPDQLILSVEPFAPPPPEAYREGVRCLTVPQSHRSNPAAKTTDWMTARKTVQDAFPPGVYEGLLLSEDGRILEGLTSNFYGILQGELRTANEGVLPGIAQQIVLEVAPVILDVRREPVHLAELLTLDEAFISSASRGIVPVVEIDGQRVGDGFPGPYTLALREAYLAWVEVNLEEL